MDSKDHVLATEPKKDENQQKSKSQRHRPKDKRRAEVSKAEIQPSAQPKE
jgi:hypothetical protein